jgi:hypothetical protein
MHSHCDNVTIVMKREIHDIMIKGFFLHHVETCFILDVDVQTIM